MRRLLRMTPLLKLWDRITIAHACEPDRTRRASRSQTFPYLFGLISTFSALEFATNRFRRLYIGLESLLAVALCFGGAVHFSEF